METRRVLSERASKRRAMLKNLLGIASLAVFPKIPRAQTTAPWLGDGGLLTDLGMELTPEQREAGVAFLRRHASVDVHAHPGRFFLEDLSETTETTRQYGPPFEERAVRDLNAGHVSASLISCVSDLKLAEMTPTGIRSTREFRPGEACADYQRQMRALKSFSRRPGLAPGRSPSDILSAQSHHRTAAVFPVEGGDFIEDRLDRIQAAFDDGVRAITIVHYHINQIGDIQSQPPVHGGLTELGKSIIREMNHRGIIVDLAHATLAVTRDVIEVSSQPVMLSHSNLVTQSFSHPRLITAEHARLIAASGGVVGAWPSGFGQSTFSDYIDAIQRLIDAVGIEHVAIGTDMDGNYKPVFRNYRDWGLIPAALMARGLHENEAAAVMGGNFMRVFKKTLSAVA